MIYTAEITYFDSTITKTAYYSTCSFVTKTTDTPASKAFYPQLIDPGSIGINLFSDGQTFGASKLSIGELIIDDTHGTSDSFYIKEGAAGGYPVVIRMGEAGLGLSCWVYYCFFRYLRWRRLWFKHDCYKTKRRIVCV